MIIALHIASVFALLTVGSWMAKGYRNAEIWWLKNELAIGRSEYERERALRLKAEGRPHPIQGEPPQ